jgi:hypothetical protein
VREFYLLHVVFRTWHAQLCHFSCLKPAQWYLSIVSTSLVTGSADTLPWTCSPLTQLLWRNVHSSPLSTLCIDLFVFLLNFEYYFYNLGTSVIRCMIYKYFFYQWFIFILLTLANPNLCIFSLWIVFWVLYIRKICLWLF